jgi:uncharacterized protein with von Willebrand factor type A (vWA) domain
MARASLPSEADDDGGKLTLNVMHFARTLRAAGLPVGPGKVLDAVSAVAAVGLGNRGDFYWALHAVFVNRRDQREVFDQAFHVFWRNPSILARMLAIDVPLELMEEQETRRTPVNRRVAEAMQDLAPKTSTTEAVAEEDRFERDAANTTSDRDVLGKMDFEQMSGDEFRRARDVVRRMTIRMAEIPTRRYKWSRSGARIDMRRTLRAALRSGGQGIPLVMRKRRKRRPPLVVLCDISGSMNRYSRLLLHFFHAVTNDQDRVHTFLFGTRLTNVTRYLRHKDVDIALERCAEAVPDWSGGTQIGTILHEFNRDWGRRVLGQGAMVLFISDGLDRDAGDGLAKEMERLHKSCRRLIWLNPMLRFDGFQPKSLGNRAIMPHVDDFRPIHNLDSLEGLASVLSDRSLGEASSIVHWRRAARDAEAEAAVRHQAEAGKAGLGFGQGMDGRCR